MEILHYPAEALPFVRAPQSKAVHQGILDTIVMRDRSTLSLGLAMVRIKNQKLYLDYGCKSMHSYILALSEQSGKDRSSIYNWLSIGETFLGHQEDLARHGFSNQDSSKLPHLAKALSQGPKDEVLSHLVSLSHRAFLRYARYGNEAPAASTLPLSELGPEAPSHFPSPQIPPHTMDYSFIHGGKERALLRGGLGPRVFKMIFLAIHMAQNAIERGGTVVSVHLNSQAEKERFMEIAREARAQMRASAKAPGVKESSPGRSTQPRASNRGNTS
ncbi:MAG: hypothetical protein FWH12_00180 [Treponema sp.]|nr:hypothetical protein [Treponema sp.]